MIVAKRRLHRTRKPKKLHNVLQVKYGLESPSARSTISEILCRYDPSELESGRLIAVTIRCATHVLEGEADIRYIQQLLGHAQLDSTSIYTRVSIKQLQEVHARCHPAH